VTFATLIQPNELQALIAAGEVLVLDCEYDLADEDKGRAVHAGGHLPGARYLALGKDMAGTSDGTNGRHPLPGREAFAARMRALGLKAGQQVACYDGCGNFYAARLWWMLKWAGHEAVAVLDGGRQAWIDAGLPLETGEVAEGPPGDFEAGESLVADPVTAADVLANIDAGTLQVLDARSPDRFAGGPDTLDPVAGHIPGAGNRFFKDNMTADGRFRSADDLATEFAALAGGKPVVLSCGSGVTACHNALAMAVAGIEGARLYPGSWSEWIADPARPVATGEG